MNVVITFTSIGTDAGPFNLFSDANVPPFSVAFATNVPRQQLIDGFPAIVPDGTTTIRIASLGVCIGTVVFLLVPGGTTSTTTSFSSTSSTSSTSTTSTSSTTSTTSSTSSTTSTTSSTSSTTTTSTTAAPTTTTSTSSTSTTTTSTTVAPTTTTTTSSSTTTTSTTVAPTTTTTSTSSTTTTTTTLPPTTTTTTTVPQLNQFDDLLAYSAAKEIFKIDGTNGAQQILPNTLNFTNTITGIAWNIDTVLMYTNIDNNVFANFDYQSFPFIQFSASTNEYPSGFIIGPAMIDSSNPETIAYGVDITDEFLSIIKMSPYFDSFVFSNHLNLDSGQRVDTNLLNASSSRMIFMGRDASDDVRLFQYNINSVVLDFSTVVFTAASGIIPLCIYNIINDYFILTTTGARYSILSEPPYTTTLLSASFTDVTGILAINKSSVDVGPLFFF